MRTVSGDMRDLSGFGGRILRPGLPPRLQPLHAPSWPRSGGSATACCGRAARCWPASSTRTSTSSTADGWNARRAGRAPRLPYSDVTHLSQSERERLGRRLAAGVQPHAHRADRRSDSPPGSPHRLRRGATPVGGNGRLAAWLLRHQGGQGVLGGQWAVGKRDHDADRCAQQGSSPRRGGRRAAAARPRQSSPFPR